MFCPWCGKAIRDDATFCPYCGKSVGTPDVPGSGQQDDEEPLDEERMFGAPSPEDCLGAMAGVPSSGDGTKGTKGRVDADPDAVLKEGDTLYVFLPGSDPGEADVDAPFASFASKDPDSCYIYNAIQHTGWYYFNQ